MTIHLLCDRCRAEGQLGDDPFAAYADLLDFEPVPRKRRADGWDAECQRAFIAILAATGSARQAAAAVGKAQFGVENLKKAPGNESFMAAFERALDFHAENRSLRLADGVRAASALVAHRQAVGPKPAWSTAATRRPALAAAAAEEEDDTAARLAFLEDVTRIYLLKLEAERTARTAGRIAEADFYLRQLTWLEVALDLASPDAVKLFRDLRHRGIPALDIAQTPLSAFLDEARRDHWLRCGDPPRPAPTPFELLVEQDGGIFTEPTTTVPARTKEEKLAEYAREAELQILWEAEARADFERRSKPAEPKDRDAKHRRDLGEEPGGGRPTGGAADRIDVTEFTSVTGPRLVTASQPTTAPDPSPPPPERPECEDQ